MDIKNFPPPRELTRALIDEMQGRATAGALVAEYVLRYDAPTWVTVSCEGVIANVPGEIVEPDPHRDEAFRIRARIEWEVD